MGFTVDGCAPGQPGCQPRGAQSAGPGPRPRGGDYYAGGAGGRRPSRSQQTQTGQAGLFDRQKREARLWMIGIGTVSLAVGIGVGVAIGRKRKRRR